MHRLETRLQRPEFGQVASLTHALLSMVQRPASVGQSALVWQVASGLAVHVPVVGQFAGVKQVVAVVTEQFPAMVGH